MSQLCISRAVFGEDKAAKKGSLGVSSLGRIVKFEPYIYRSRKRDSRPHHHHHQIVRFWCHFASNEFIRSIAAVYLTFIQSSSSGGRKVYLVPGIKRFIFRGLGCVRDHSVT